MYIYLGKFISYHFFVSVPLLIKSVLVLRMLSQYSWFLLIFFQTKSHVRGHPWISVKHTNVHSYSLISSRPRFTCIMLKTFTLTQRMTFYVKNDVDIPHKNMCKGGAFKSGLSYKYTTRLNGLKS